MNNRANTASAIQEMFIEDCELLFKHYGCEIVYQGTVSKPCRINAIGVIDAGCDEIELSLMLNVPFSILALSYPCQDAIVDMPDEQLEDWLLEVVNQLMGKIKGRLVKQNFTINLGLPGAFFDVGSLSDNSLKKSHTGCVFEVDGEIMECWLSVDVKFDDVVINKEPAEQESTGDIELF